jgi:hypothetical protein
MTTVMIPNKFARDGADVILQNDTTAEHHR